MKFSRSAVLSLVASSASAFAPVSRPSASSQLRSAVAVEVEAPVSVPSIPLPVQKVEEETPVAASTSTEPTTSNLDQIEPGRYSDKTNSITLPFLLRPPALDGSHAGDYGFDPLGFTETQDLYTMQEAELRHARLAMLAVVGWPLSELVAPEWMLQENGCAPSVLNGFNLLSAFATLTIFAGFGAFEYLTCFRRSSATPMGQLHQKDMEKVWGWGVAGDYNWDPAGLYSSLGKDAYARKGLRELEIRHGRSAMLGITAFAAWEKLTGHPIVENSMFFHPNLLLPALVGGYFFLSSIYELEESDTFLRLQVSSEGQARLENLKMALPQADPEQQAAMLEKASEALEKTKDFAKSLPEKYQKLQDSASKY